MNTKLFLLSFILLLLIQLNSFPYATAQSPIYDTDGDEVKPGVEYYIAYPIGFRGGIGLPATANWTCPASVIEMPFETQNGFQVSFHPVDPNESEIREGTTDLYIRFHDVMTGCPDGAAVWSVARVVEKSFVVAGRKVDNLSGQFKVVRDGTFNQYKFYHCRNIAWFECGYVGTTGQGLRNRLVVNMNQDSEQVPLSIVFRKKAADGMIRLPK